MKKDTKCDKCNSVQGNEFDGSGWNEFSDNYEDTIRTYWLCSKHDQVCRKKLNNGIAYELN